MFDQWSCLWENVPVPNVNLILSHGSFKMECSWEPLSPPCAAWVFFPFPASASPPRLALCILRACAGDERKGPPASGLYPLLVSTSRNSSHYSALSWTKIWTSILFWMMMKIGEKEKEAFVLQTGLLVMKWLYNLIAASFADVGHLRCEAVLILSILFLFRTAVPKSSCLPFWWETYRVDSVKTSCFFSNTMGTERARVRGMIRRVFLFYLKLVSSECILFSSRVTASLFTKSSCEGNFRLCNKLHFYDFLFGAIQSYASKNICMTHCTQTCHL